MCRICICICIYLYITILRRARLFVVRCATYVCMQNACELVCMHLLFMSRVCMCTLHVPPVCHVYARAHYTYVCMYVFVCMYCRIVHVHTALFLYNCITNTALFLYNGIYMQTYTHSYISWFFGTEMCLYV